MRLHHLLVACALAVPALLAGCTGDNAGVSNTPDAFSYGGQASGKSGSETYEWRNSGSKAMVSWGGQVAEGSLAISIRDAAGKEVYSTTLSARNGGAAGPTSTGQPGEWSIRLTWTGFTGNMGLAVTNGGTGGSAGYTVPTYGPSA